MKKIKYNLDLFDSSLCFLILRKHLIHINNFSLSYQNAKFRQINSLAFKKKKKEKVV